MRPISHSAQAWGLLGGTLRGWQAMPLSMRLPPAPQSRRESHTAWTEGRAGWRHQLRVAGAGGQQEGQRFQPVLEPVPQRPGLGCISVPQQGSQASFCPAPAGDTAPEATDLGRRSPSRQGSYSCREQSPAVPYAPARGVRRPGARGHGGASPVRSRPITAGPAWRPRGWDRDACPPQGCL